MSIKLFDEVGFKYPRGKVSLYWMDWSIGAGFNFSTPIFKKYPNDKECWRALNFVAHLLCFQIQFVLLAFVDHVDEEESHVS